MNSHKSIGVIGGGISGLTTAFHLKKRGFDVTLYEKSSQAGGVIGTERKDGWLIETGPNTLLVKDREVWDMLDELGLKDRILTANPAAQKRYIVKNKEAVPLPSSPLQFFNTPLFSGSAKRQLLMEPFVSQSDDRDESISSFVSRRIGEEILEYAVNPFVAGIFAGDPSRLSLKHTFGTLHRYEQKYGSLSAGAFMQLFSPKRKKSRRALISFREGLQTLIDRLLEQLGPSVICQAEINSIIKRTSGWQISYSSGHTNYLEEHEALVYTAPLYTLSKIQANIDTEEYLNKLAEVHYAPMSVLHLGFEREQIDHSLDGFGMLVPESEPFKILGALFSSTLFPGRAPEDHVLLTVFIGGSRSPELAGLPADALREQAMEDLDTILGIKAAPRFFNHTYWPRAIPQYEVGYDSFVKCMRKLEGMNSGLFLSGNFRNGVSVPDCIKSGTRTAQKAAAFAGS